MVHFFRLFENLKLAVKQLYQSGQFLLGINCCKMPKLKISNGTFGVIFKHCEINLNLPCQFGHTSMIFELDFTPYFYTLLASFTQL